MKPFDSSETNLATPTKLEFKIMKETADEVSTETQRLSETQSTEVQNGSKKLLESVDLNTSSIKVSENKNTPSITVSENNVKKDSARTSGSDSEKENEVTANGFPEVTGPNETESLSKSKSSDQGELASPKTGLDGITDCSSEENTGIQTTVEESGNSISDCDEAKVNSVMPEDGLEEAEQKDAFPLSNGDIKLVAEKAEVRDILDKPMDTVVHDENEETLDAPDEALDVRETASADRDKTVVNSLGLLGGPNSLDAPNAGKDKSSCVDGMMDVDVEENELMASSEENAEHSCDEEMESKLLEASEPQSCDISSDVGSSEFKHVEHSGKSGENKDSISSNAMEADKSEPSDKTGANKDSVSSDALLDADRVEPSDTSGEDKNLVSSDSVMKAEHLEPSHKSGESKDPSSDTLMEADQLEPSHKSGENIGSISSGTLMETARLEPVDKSGENRDPVSSDALMETDRLESSDKSGENKDSVSSDALMEADRLEPSDKSGENRDSVSCDILMGAEQLEPSGKSRENKDSVSSDFLMEDEELEPSNNSGGNKVPISCDVLMEAEELESSDKSGENKDSVSSDALMGGEQLEPSDKSGENKDSVSSDALMEADRSKPDKSGENEDSVSSDALMEADRSKLDKSGENKDSVSSDALMEADRSKPDKSGESKDPSDTLMEADQLEPSHKSVENIGSISSGTLMETARLEPVDKSGENIDPVSSDALMETDRSKPDKSGENKYSVSSDALEAEQFDPSDKSGENKEPVSSDALMEAEQLEPSDKSDETKGPANSNSLLEVEKKDLAGLPEETKCQVSSDVLSETKQLETVNKSGENKAPLSSEILMEVEELESSHKSEPMKDSGASNVLPEAEHLVKSKEIIDPISADVSKDQLELSCGSEDIKSSVSSDALSNAEQSELSDKPGEIKGPVSDVVHSPSELLETDVLHVGLQEDTELVSSDTSTKDTDKTASNSLVESAVCSDVTETAKSVASDNVSDSSKAQSSDKVKELTEPEPVERQLDCETDITKEVSDDELMDDPEFDSMEDGAATVSVKESLVDSTDSLLKSIDNALGMDDSESPSSDKAPITNGMDASDDGETITQVSVKPPGVNVTSSKELLTVAKEADGNQARKDGSNSEKSAHHNGPAADSSAKCSGASENSASDLGGSEKKKNSDKVFEKLKVSYSQVKSNSLSTAASCILTDMGISDFDSGTADDSLRTTKLRDDIEDDLRAMEDSMWSDDIGKSKEKFVTKISPEVKSIPVVPHDNVPEEERLNRKRTSEGIAEDVTKRVKVSDDNNVDSDVGSETPKRHSEDDVVERESKKVRTMDEELEEEGDKRTVYRSNLDKIIDQVATGVINGEGEETMDGSVIDDDLQEVTMLDSDKDSTTDTSKSSKPLPFVRKLHAEELKNISRNDLEELVVQKICEVVTERSEVGELRQRTAFLEQMVENWRKKAHSLSKQVRDMEMVMKRFVNDQKNKKDRIVLPVKITRSVGLQVHLGQPNNQIGLNKPRPTVETTRPPVRRRSERPTPPQTPTSTPSTPKTPTPTPTSISPPKIPATPPPPPPPAKTVIVTASNSPTVPSASVVRTVAVAATTKTVPTPSKTNVSRPLAPNTSASTNLTARLASTTVTPRVSKPVYSTTTATPIAPKPNQDLIDLTDEEDRSKSNTLRNALTVTSTDALIPTSVTSVLPTTAITTAGVGRGIRVVQQHQLTANTTTTAILTPTGTDGGQRLAYLVPTSTMSNQQRQLVLAPQQVRAGGVMSVPGRPTILFKSGPVVSMPQGALPPGTVVQAGVASSASALLRPNPTLATLAPQQRSTALRLPATIGRMASTVNSIVTNQPTVATHPAPLPSLPPYTPTSLNLKLAPPKPELKISKVSTRNAQGIVLSWNMTLSSEHEEVASYQLYAYQEGSALPSTSLWKKVGDVKALPLPMACTLTQFQEGHKYHFAVRAVDVHMRCGQFSAPGNIMLTRK